MRKTIITCDHCNKEISIDYITIRVRGIGLDQELELCKECAQEYTDMTIDFIQPQHYKY